MKHTLLIIGLSVSMLAMGWAQADTTLFKVVEEMPRFPGCEHPDSTLEARKACANQLMLEYIYSRVRYPAEAREQDIQGMAVVSFVIEKDGRITHPQVVRDPGGGTGQAALAVVQRMQEDELRWIPGKQGGQPQRVQFNLPVRFRLEEPIPYVIIGRDTVYTEFEQGLAFEGGPDSLSAFLTRRLAYPPSGNDSCLVGQVDIQILVRPNNDVRIINIVDYNNLGFDFWYESAQAAVSTYGRWIPARYAGRAVASAFDLSLSFLPTTEACETTIERYQEAFAIAEEGANLFDQELPEEAFRKMSAALAMFPQDGKLLLLRGQAYLDANRFEEACADLLKARYLSLVDWYDSILPLCK